MARPYFLYVGNAYPHKNLKRVITAITDYNLKRREKIMFFIVSSRSVFTEKVEKIVEHLNAKDDVKLLGFVSDDELKKLYNKAEGYIFPSLYEGFGLPGLEAMAAGCLVLASEIPVFKEVYKDNVIYFNPFDSNSIEKTIEDVVGMDKNKKTRLIHKAKAFTKRYSWAKMAKETLQVYNEALK